jgi:hypothetical protein
MGLHFEECVMSNVASTRVSMCVQSRQFVLGGAAAVTCYPAAVDTAKAKLQQDMHKRHQSPPE